MPRSKRSANYAPELKRLLDHALDSGERIEILCGSIKSSNRLRNQLYAYINALDHEDIAEGVPLHTRRGTIYRRIQISSEKELLVLINRSNTDEMKTINAYLGGTSARVQAEAPLPEVEEDASINAITELYGIKKNA